MSVISDSASRYCKIGRGWQWKQQRLAPEHLLAVVSEEYMAGNDADVHAWWKGGENTSQARAGAREQKNTSQ